VNARLFPPLRVPGHTLRYEGRPIRDGDYCGTPWRTARVVCESCRTAAERAADVEPTNWLRRTGDGHGQCACGAISDCLPNTHARRRWHRKHKVEVLANSDLAGVRHPLVNGTTP
jgi:hypothetical protein